MKDVLMLFVTVFVALLVVFMLGSLVLLAREIYIEYKVDREMQAKVREVTGRWHEK